MKKFLGLTMQEAIMEAIAQKRSFEVITSEEMEISTSEGNGATLWFEDNICYEYEFNDWI